MSIAFKTFSGSRHEFRQRVKVPVGMANVLVAQIAREDQDPPRRSSVAGLPALQHVTGMGMTQIVNSRRTAWMGQRSAQP